MKILTLVTRLLLGLVFTVFGLNGILHFIPQGPMPAGPGTDFATILMQSHYMLVVALFEIAGGVLLLWGRYVALGLALLAPVVVNILMFHVFLTSTGLPIAIVTAILWLVTAYPVRSKFAALASA